jgi:hypothetical protein
MRLLAQRTRKSFGRISQDAILAIAAFAFSEIAGEALWSGL